MLLKDKVAIVTGAAIVERFVGRGAKAIIADLSEIGREGGAPTADVITATARPSMAPYGQVCEM